MSASVGVDGVLDAYDEARKYLGFDTEVTPIPRDELVAQLEAEGYDRSVACDALDLSVERGDLVRVKETVIAVEDGEPVKVDDGVRPVRDEPVEDTETDENSEKEAGSSEYEASNPRVSATENAALEDAADTVDETRVLEVFETCVEFYHEHLDDELPEECDAPVETPREYFEDLRGWDADTVEEKRLGYAPVGHGHELLDLLMSEGYTREEILGTGLFYDLGTPHFEGRVVFPYFDRDGRPCYAISRTTGHPEDPKANQKYTKAVKTKDYSHVDKPIFGLRSVAEADNAERVLVAGGIADAITLHEAGYPCISPVTTVQFKGDHRDEVVELLDEHDADMYVVNDAERPTVNEVETGGDVSSVGEALSITQYGEGLRGAFANAEYFGGEGVDVYLVDLPGGDDDLDKLDPDDFVQDGWASVETVLVGAKPAEQRGDFKTWKSRRLSSVPVPEKPSEQRETGFSSGSSSELFELDFSDVSGLRAGDRGKNPLGHHGNSTDYFTVVEQSGTVYGFDHKYGVGYYPLPYILVEAGARRADNPNGDLDDEEVFTAWQHAKEERYISDDDKIPRRALRHVAASATEWDGDLVEHETADGDTFEGLPTEVYNAALDHVEEDLGLSTGRRQSSGGGGLDPEAVLPHSPKARLITNGWDWTRDGSRGEELRDRIRKRTTDKLVDAYEHAARVLLEAIPTGGKSYGAVKACLESDEDVTILTERRDLYDQIKEWCQELGLSSYTLPAFHRDCPTADGTHGDEWKEKVRDLRRRGATPKKIHTELETPCQDEGACPYSRRWDFDADDYDILIGNYRHAHVDSVVSGRAVVFDEDTSGAFETVLSGAPFKSAVTQYLRDDDAIPFDDFTELLENRDEEIPRDATLEAVGEPEWRPGDVFDGTTTHAGAELAVYALLKGEDLGNGLERATLPDDAVAVFNRETTTFGILRPPSLEYVRSVVALDGTPTPEMWRARLGERLNHVQVLTDDERREYVETALNHRVIPTTPHVKPYSSDRNVTVEKDEALLREIRRTHEREPPLITTKKAEDKYDETGVLDLVDGVKHHGDMKGSNDFEEKRLGVIIGSRHFGDNYVKKWGAYLGDAVETPDRSDEQNRGVGLSYGETGDKILRHMREHETLQGLMRFGRDGRGAVIYCHTNTLPSWYTTETETPDEDAVVRPRSEAERDVIRELRRRGEGRTGELSEAVEDVTERRVLQILNRLKTRGVVNATVEGRGFVWHDDGLHRVNDAGDVSLDSVDLDELPDEEVHEISRNSSYTASFVKTDDSHASKADDVASKASQIPQHAGSGGEPPPD